MYGDLDLLIRLLPFARLYLSTPSGTLTWHELLGINTLPLREHLRSPFRVARVFSLISDPNHYHGILDSAFGVATLLRLEQLRVREKGNPIPMEGAQPETIVRLNGYGGAGKTPHRFLGRQCPRLQGFWVQFHNFPLVHA